VLSGIKWLGGVLFTVWATLAVWFDAPGEVSLRIALVILLLVAALSLVGVARRKHRTGWLAVLPAIAVLAWWLALTPRADREWTPDVDRVAHASIEGNLLTVQNVRNFRYRTENDSDAVWETRQYRLDEVVGYDLFLSFWGPTLYAHTISSWEFADGRHLAISIETRKEKGESYSAVAGFFRQYELHYVVADERDVVGLRAAQRGESVYLYRMRGSPDTARRGLQSFVTRLNELAGEPAWYNALVTNCTTAIWYHVKHVTPDAIWDWRLLANGYLDELAWERGAINRTMPFALLRTQSDVTQRAAKAINSKDFSELIRRELPERSPPVLPDVPPA
jgi:hypothetical protein